MTATIEQKLKWTEDNYRALVAREELKRVAWQDSASYFQCATIEMESACVALFHAYTCMTERRNDLRGLNASNDAQYNAMLAAQSILDAIQDIKIASDTLDICGVY